MKAPSWQTTPINLTGPLDTRSRPADLGPGALRWKLNLSVNQSGKLSRRAGHAALSFGARSDTPSAVANWDFHRRGAPREPITLLSEITSPERARYLFAGTQGRVDWLNNSTSEWQNILNGMGSAGTRWKAAGLREKAYFTNNFDPVQVHTLGSASAVPVAELLTQGVTRAKVIVQYQNVIVVMNLSGQEYDISHMPVGPVSRLPNRVQWSDYRNGESWAFGAASVAGFQDLDDGEEILNCAELAGVLWIFTDRAIWWMYPNVTTNSVFGFKRWYAEPKNRTACLRYENSLVATGREFFWLGESTAYWCNQFSTAPTSPDWLLKATGRLFEGPHRIDPSWCASPVGEFLPDQAGSAREVWFSYPQLGSASGVNDYTLVLSFNTESQNSPYQTGDQVDYGYTAFCNFTHVLGEGLTCATTATFIGASGSDFCLKSIGGVFYREEVKLAGGDVTADIPDASYVRTQTGYFSQMMLLAPLGSPTREKILRNVILDHDTADARTSNPNLINLRIGNSYHLADPLSLNGSCAVQWHQIDTREMLCPDVDSGAKMEADGTRPDDATEWPNQAEQGRYLYVDLKITNSAGGPPIGSDSAFKDLSFDALTLP